MSDPVMRDDNPVAPTPRFAEWISTFRCSQRCAHCAASAGAPLPDEMDFDEAVAMFDQLRNLGVTELCISGGEFTTRDDWLALTQRALAGFSQVRIISNGWLGASLFETLDRIDDRQRLGLLLSIDGLEESHDRRRGEGTFASVLAALASPSEISREVITTVARDNRDDLWPLLDICRSHDVDFWTVQPVVPRGRMQPDGALGRAGFDWVADFIEEARARVGDQLRIGSSGLVNSLLAKRQGENGTGCACAHDRFVVLPDGGVTACVFLEEERCGNLRKQPLETIWHGAAMTAQRLAIGGYEGDPSRPGVCTALRYFSA